MVFEKIASMFKKPNKTTGKVSSSNASQPRKVVDHTHIGDLGEFKIGVQLRQFSKENRYLNDLLIANPRSKTGYAQIDHVLITPYAVFVIETKNYKGNVRGKREDKTWRVNGKFNMYNPLRQNRTHINALKRVIAEYKDIKFVSLISFTKRCELRNVDQELREIESDELVVYDIKLTDCIERKMRRLKIENQNSLLSESDVIRIYELISEKNITDPKARAEHVDKAIVARGTH
jgi:hypothetical protein